MDLKKIVLYSALSPFIAYYYLKEDSLRRIVKKTVKNLDFAYALKHQNIFLSKLSVDTYPELKLKNEHRETFDILKNMTLENNLHYCSGKHMLLKSSISYDMRDGEKYCAEIKTSWNREIDAPVKISISSSIDSKLESGIIFAFLPLPLDKDQLIIDDIIGFGAKYHSLSNRIMHERKVGLKYAQDQYFLLDSFDSGYGGLCGVFGSKIDTNPEFRGLMQFKFKI